MLSPLNRKSRPILLRQIGQNHEVNQTLLPIRKITDRKTGGHEKQKLNRKVTVLRFPMVLQMFDLLQVQLSLDVSSGFVKQHRQIQ